MGMFFWAVFHHGMILTHFGVFESFFWNLADGIRFGAQLSLLVFFYIHFYFFTPSLEFLRVTAPKHALDIIFFGQFVAYFDTFGADFGPSVASFGPFVARSSPLGDM